MYHVFTFLPNNVRNVNKFSPLFSCYLLLSFLAPQISTYLSIYLLITPFSQNCISSYFCFQNFQYLHFGRGKNSVFVDLGIFKKILLLPHFKQFFWLQNYKLKAIFSKLFEYMILLNLDFYFTKSVVNLSFFVDNLPLSFLPQAEADFYLQYSVVSPHTVFRYELFFIYSALDIIRSLNLRVW